MKLQKFYVILSLVLLSTLCLFSQNSYHQNFDLGMPSDILLLNVDGLTPHLEEDASFKEFAWQVTNSRFFESFAAMSVSWYENGGGPADDWMILPKMQMTASSKIVWQAISTTFGDFPDSYEVLFVEETPTLENIDLVSTQVLLSVENEEFEMPVEHQLVLSELAGKTGHIAFRNITSSGDALQIDNIEITGIEFPIDIEQVSIETFDLQLFPNPTNVKSILQYHLTNPSKVHISLQNVAGQILKQYEQGKQSTGEHQLQLEAENLSKGVYFLQLQTEMQYAVVKWVVE